MDIPTKEIAPGVQMPVISIGAGGLEKENAKTIVSNWLSIGGKGIDTALRYNNQAEIKAAIEESGLSRKDLFLTTKIPNCNVDNLASDVQTDLDLLGTDYLDLLLIHGAWSGDCALAWKEMEQVYEGNQARAIGVSNFKRENLETILFNATIVPHVNQIQLNILQNNPDTIEFSTEHGITVEAYSPLGRANHSGDISGNVVIQEIAKRHKVTTYQIAIKWVLQHNWILTFQSSSKEHQAADADVFGFTLTYKEMQQLDWLSGLGETNLNRTSDETNNLALAVAVSTLCLMIGIVIIWRRSGAQKYHRVNADEHTTSDLQMNRMGKADRHKTKLSLQF